MVQKLVYRYEDENGFGPFYNALESLKMRGDDGWRDCLDSKEALEEWFLSRNIILDKKKYHVGIYLINFPSDFEAKVLPGCTHISFKTDWIVEKIN